MWDGRTQNELPELFKKGTAGGLAGLYEAPTSLLFKGSWEEALQEAFKDSGRWMVRLFYKV